MPTLFNNKFCCCCSCSFPLQLSPLNTERGPVSETICLIFIYITGRWTKSTNPMILIRFLVFEVVSSVQVSRTNFLFICISHPFMHSYARPITYPWFDYPNNVCEKKAVNYEVSRYETLSMPLLTASFWCPDMLLVIPFEKNLSTFSLYCDRSV
jgi:hypothetical protein